MLSPSKLKQVRIHKLLPVRIHEVLPLDMKALRNHELHLIYIKLQDSIGNNTVKIRIRENPHNVTCIHLNRLLAKQVCQTWFNPGAKLKISIQRYAVFEKPSVIVSQRGGCFRRWWWRLSAHAIRKPSSVATGIGWRGWSTITPQSRRCPRGDPIEEWRSSAATHRYRKQLQKHHSLYQSQNWD